VSSINLRYLAQWMTSRLVRRILFDSIAKSKFVISLASGISIVFLGLEIIIVGWVAKNVVNQLIQLLARLPLCFSKAFL